MEISIDALRVVVSDGLTERPLFVGALSAEQLSSIADVPSFTTGTDQRVIAGNVLRPPIKDWQRPLSEAKRSAITQRFNRAGEFMPNPVLLSVGRRELVNSQPKSVNGQQTGLHTITVRTDGGALPLWVLDGQHRIRGLAASSQRDNAVPFVLLYSERPDVYRPEDSAKIFAEVSTEATPLSDLHREWLQFAFNLSHYNPHQVAPAGLDAGKHHQAMETVAILCEHQDFDGTVNPFFDKIQFNPERPAVGVHHHGFALSAPALKEWILDEYYRQPCEVGAHETPLHVAKEIAKAVQSLIMSIATPPEVSAFFGVGARRHQYMERGFVCAVLSRLLIERSPNWPNLLDSLRFGTTDWNFSWVVTTGGSEGTTSKHIARNVLVEAFRSGVLPNDTADLVSYLRGDNASIRFVASYLTPSGRPAAADRLENTIPASGVKVFPTAGRRHVKQFGQAGNIGKLRIVDPAAPLDKTISASRLRSGIVIVGSQELVIQADHYGGLSQQVRLTLRTE